MTNVLNSIYHMTHVYNEDNKSSNQSVHPSFYRTLHLMLFKIWNKRVVRGIAAINTRTYRYLRITICLLRINKHHLLYTRFFNELFIRQFIWACILTTVTIKGETRGSVTCLKIRKQMWLHFVHEGCRWTPSPHYRISIMYFTSFRKQRNITRQHNYWYAY